MTTATLDQPISVDGDDLDSAIRRAQRGIIDGDQRVGQASVQMHAPSGMCYSALPDPVNVGKWIPYIVGADLKPQPLPGRLSTERDALQVALCEICSRHRAYEDEARAAMSDSDCEGME